jgi:pyruvate formate lyase activating enzyme
MHTALCFEKLNDNKVKCLLCPHGCILDDGKAGICRVRSNENGVLVSENYGKVSSINLDPIEKKPLYHFFPGMHVLSIGSVGCNLQCNFCQNCEISQTGVRDFPRLKSFSAEEIVKNALESIDNIGIAFTYNEPVVFFEYMMDVARLSKSKGLKNIMVSNGFINEEPLKQILPYIDAFNIDLKAFDDEFYIKNTHSHLEPVKRSLQLIRESGKHLEITNLVIPGLNDKEEDFTAMVDWISLELGDHTILHLSRYFPRYKAKQPPTHGTLLLQFREIAIKKLKFVYIGNCELCENMNDTYCPKCYRVLVKRYGYDIKVVGLTENGTCSHCGESVFIQ